MNERRRIIEGAGSVVYPVKGDLINMTLGNATPEAGTQDQYRVLHINGSIAEVVAMYDQTTVAFDTAGANTYEGKALDTYLNTTWYGTLSDTAKAAIVDKTFTQDSWYSDATGSPSYSGYYGETNPGTTAYTVSLGKSAYGNSITRHVYALGMQDAIDYVKDTTLGDGELQNYNIWKMLWNTTSAPSTSISSVWLRSAVAVFSSYARYVLASYGRLSYSPANMTRGARPALTIDLSKIDFEILGT